jgi:hypothetical protein
MKITAHIKNTNNKTLFSELNGFIVYDKQAFENFIKKHKIESNIMEALGTSNLGSEISKAGIAIPVLNITADYYSFSAERNDLFYNLKEKQPKIHSTGWILYSRTGLIKIAGIGYFLNYKNPSNIKSITLEIAKGWNKIELAGGLNDNSEPTYEIACKPVQEKPNFTASLTDNLDIFNAD